MAQQKEWSARATFATLPRTTRGLGIVVGGDPKGKNILYCNGSSVVIRDIDNPAICDIYTEHSYPTTVAKYAPSGFYICSGDDHGKIRIWDTTQKTHPLKSEYQPISGAIKDITWSPDSKRIAVAGDGKDKMAHVFLFDTGTSNGNLSGQSKVINSIDMRPKNPLRVITASDDYTVAIFEGPPFKFKTTKQKHSRFVNIARYAPDGATFVTAGSDGRVFLYNWDDAEVLGEIGDPAVKNKAAHDGGIYALCWSPDGKEILTASGDKTAKIFNVADKSLVAKFTFGDQIENQQVGCLWQGDHILTVSLNGWLNYLDRNHPEKPLKIVKGHSKPITALVYVPESCCIYTGDGAARWNADTGESEMFTEAPHSIQIQDMCVNREGQIMSIGLDDQLVFSDLAYMDKPHKKVRLPSQPKGCTTMANGHTFVVGIKQLWDYKFGSLSAEMKVKFDGLCVAAHPHDFVVAVGCNDSKVRLFQSDNGQIKETKTIDSHSADITDVKFSPDGKLLAVSDANRRIVPYKYPELTSISPKEWTHHTARVNTIAFSPNSRFIASGSLDTHIMVWDCHNPGNSPIIIKCAHQMNQVTRVSWRDNATVISTGQDANVKQWNIDAIAGQ